jgi:hypothetical protein
MTNPFSKDYVSKVKIDHRDRTYKRPVLNQPPKNARKTLVNEQDRVTGAELRRRISWAEI